MMKIIYLLALTGVSLNAIQFGERITKQNSSLIDAVFRPNKLTNDAKNHINVNIKEKIIEQDVTQQTSSQQLVGNPISPPPPPTRPLISNLANHQQNRNQQSLHESESVHEPGLEPGVEPGHSLLAEFSMNIPKEFPNPNKELRPNYKREQMGRENNQGKPWGSKRSVTYRDPKNPHNFMEMSEVTMSINRQMNPDEAQSQIRSFIEAAQSGQYGPLSAIRVDNEDNHHSGAASHIVPSEPLEPIEPNFPDF